MQPSTVLDDADLRAWRARMGWTQARAAEELGIHLHTLKNMDGGQRSPSRTLLLLASLLERFSFLRSTLTAAMSDVPRAGPAALPRPKKARKPSADFVAEADDAPQADEHATSPAPASAPVPLPPEDDDRQPEPESSDPDEIPLPFPDAQDEDVGEPRADEPAPVQEPAAATLQAATAPEEIGQPDQDFLAEADGAILAEVATADAATTAVPEPAAVPERIPPATASLPAAPRTVRPPSPFLRPIPRLAPQVPAVVVASVADEPAPAPVAVEPAQVPAPLDGLRICVEILHGGWKFSNLDEVVRIARIEVPRAKSSGQRKASDPDAEDARQAEWEAAAGQRHRGRLGMFTTMLADLLDEDA
jgi:DNA-binding XRE family transcriptional regulator